MDEVDLAHGVDVAQGITGHGDEVPVRPGAIRPRPHAVIPTQRHHEFNLSSGSSLNPEVEINTVSGGDRVDQGLEVGGWVFV
ncbi:hypothetical protein ACWD3K_37205, partial [Streptomyces sp. NPDC002778]